MRDAQQAVAAYERDLLALLEKRAADYERAGTADWSIPLKIIAQELRSGI